MVSKILHFLGFIICHSIKHYFYEITFRICSSSVSHTHTHIYIGTNAHTSITNGLSQLLWLWNRHQSCYQVPDVEISLVKSFQIFQEEKKRKKKSKKEIEKRKKKSREAQREGKRNWKKEKKWRGSNCHCTLLFTFELITLGKAWTPLSHQLWVK